MKYLFKHWPGLESQYHFSLLFNFIFQNWHWFFPIIPLGWLFSGWSRYSTNNAGLFIGEKNTVHHLRSLFSFSFWLTLILGFFLSLLIINDLQFIIALIPIGLVSFAVMEAKPSVRILGLLIGVVIELITSLLKGKAALLLGPILVAFLVFVALGFRDHLKNTIQSKKPSWILRIAFGIILLAYAVLSRYVWNVL